MLACVVPGRPVRTDFTRVDETHFVLALPEAAAINHLTIFLTDPLPPSFGATIHFLWPGRPSWQLLGVISNEKPSAVFKITGLKASRAGMFSQVSNQSATDAQLGVCIESLEQAQNELAQLTVSTSNAVIPHSQNQPDSNATVAQKILTNLSNYIMSFGTLRDPQTGMECIPVKVFQDWYSSIERKIAADPNWPA